MTSDASVESRSGTFDLALVVGLIAVACGSIFTLVRTLGERSFWYDEAYTFCFVTASWADFERVLRQLDIGVGFYYLLVRFWAAVAGTSKVDLRLFSVVFALASIYALYLLTREFFTRRVALTAAALLFCNAFWFQQAQTARVYSLAGFLAIVTSYAFIRAVRSADGRLWSAVYATLMTLLVMSQFAIGLGLFAAHAVSFFIVGDRRMTLRQAGPLVVALVVIFGVGAYVVSSVGATLLHTPVHVTFRSVWSQVASLLGRKASLAVLGALAVSFVVTSRRVARKHAVTLAIWTVVPIAMIAAMSLFDSAALGGRYMYSALFPFIMLAAAAIWHFERRPAVLAALAVALLAEAYGLDQYLAEPWRDFDEQIARLSSGARAGDAVLFAPPFLAVRVYVALAHDRLELSNGVDTLPSPLSRAWQTVDQRKSEPDWTALPKLAGRRLWLVTMAKSDSPDGSCDDVASKTAALHPASVSVICFGRE